MDKTTYYGRPRPRILVADDSAEFREQMHNLLHRQFDIDPVGEAQDGEEAVRLALKLRPDIVLMDIVMPRLNGIEATRQITSEFPSVRVVALSMHADEGFRRAMLDAGASIYLLKDNVVEELPDALRGLTASPV